MNSVIFYTAREHIAVPLRGKMRLRVAEISDLDDLKAMYGKVVKNMNESGLDIWNDVYPCSFLEEDIQTGCLYILCDEKCFAGAFSLKDENKGAGEVTWNLSGRKPVYIEKLAVAAEYRGRGCGSVLLDEAVTYPEKTKTIIKSTTDPESGLMNRPGKPNAFCYLNHQTSDAECGIITDVFVTPGNVNDCTPHTSRLETQIDKFGFKTEAICADAGYDNSEVYDAMLKRGIRTYIPKKRKPNNASSHTTGFEPEAFNYNSEEDFYVCPQGKILEYSCYSKKSQKKRYLAAKKDCSSCPCRQQCMGNSKNSRLIERLMHEEARQEQMKNLNTPEYFAALRLRKIWCEGNFSHQKSEHNLRWTYKRGIERVTEQCLLSACAMNLIRLVKAAIRPFSFA